MPEFNTDRHDLLARAACLALIGSPPLADQRQAKRTLRRAGAAYTRTHQLLRRACQDAPATLDTFLPDVEGNAAAAETLLYATQALPRTRVGLHARGAALDNLDVAREALGVTRRRLAVLSAGNVDADLRREPSATILRRAGAVWTGVGLRVPDGWRCGLRLTVMVGGQPHLIRVPARLAERVQRAAATQTRLRADLDAPRLRLWVTSRSRELLALAFV
ncbi:hypothetical protein D3875_04360 [Deinococcus cavernae]|uniref:Uncharacterized protein n=1 Tax=Deinococcus cavernae TaxID=2320857 RepID=A0A418VEI3_9DEIO|nr:hypothetical protein [Deinococcus cavernae]RJF74519.1 hypothetical protein D3875_04360 [Deinococcus cavernae]